MCQRKALTVVAAGVDQTPVRQRDSLKAGQLKAAESEEDQHTKEECATKPRIFGS